MINLRGWPRYRTERCECGLAPMCNDFGNHIPYDDGAGWRFGCAGKGLWSELDRLRAGPSRKGVVPVEPVLRASVKFFGRHRGGFIRDGVLLGLR